jgi:class 3 adenylate cyclase/tetratricopeptide (TPR) repeat protein
MDCLRCSRPAPADARFCPGCGTPLVGVGAGTRFASPHAYTPTHLAERILTARDAVEGERKQVTVLFADLKSSMELLVDRDPEEIGPVLDQVLEAMMEAVHRYEGTVNQVMGDGIMALFGAPLAHEDHAVRACYAALRLQERIAALGEAVQRSHGLPLHVRVGLNSGEVVVRSIGSDLRLSYAAVGQTVHLAARMEQMARPGSILATADTVAMAGPRVRTRALGPVPVKGLPAPVQVHEILGAAAVQSRVEAAAQRGLTRFVGRELELARMVDVLESVGGAAGQVIAVTGEAGVGKSRLVHEFCVRARAEGALVAEAVAAPYGRATGDRPGLDMIRRYFGLASGDDPGAVRHRIAARMVALDPALEEAVPATLWLLGVLRPGGAFYALDPAARRRRALEAMVRLVAAEARRQPFVLVFEDLQWIDSETEAALDGLITALPPSTLLVLTYRPEYVDRWRSRQDCTRLRLEPLDPLAAATMLDALLGDDPGVRPLRGPLIDRTGGNPLFLEECVRALAASGVLAGERGAHRLARPATTVEVPATVRSVLEARIDRLPPEQKRVLQCAAVIGDEFPVALLEAIADLPPDGVRRALRGLEEAELVAETALFPDVGHVFVHALIHDVAYHGLLHDRRRALHARIVEVLERSGAEERDEVERLAHHAFSGELWERAVTYLRQAGQRHLGRLPGRETIGLFERALVALAHLPDTPDTRALAVDLRCDLRNALVPVGDHARLLAVLREAEALAVALGDDRRLGRVTSYLSNCLWNVGESEASAEAGLRTLAIAERLGDLDLEVISNLSLGGAYRTLGDYRQAVEFLRRNVGLLRGDAEQETFGLAGLASVLSRGHLAWSLAELGEFDEAVARAEEAIRIAETADQAYSLAHAHLGLGGVLLRQGRVGEAMAVLERGLAHTRDVPVLRPPMAADLAVVYAVAGRSARALALATEAVQGASHMGRVGRLSLLTTHLGEVHLLAGRLDEAAAQARRALVLARDLKERGNEVYALRLLGVVAAERTPADAAEAQACFTAAIQVAEGLGMRPLLARCHLGLGRLARQAGDGPGAAKHLETAGALLRELGMTFWLERLDRSHVSPRPGSGAGR